MRAVGGNVGGYGQGRFWEVSKINGGFQISWLVGWDDGMKKVEGYLPMVYASLADPCNRFGSHLK